MGSLKSLKVIYGVKMILQEYLKFQNIAYIYTT
ncbi:hypothetical protein FHS10_005463 [Mucilaginibacter dorajii]|nr:hypothetical protein [Mucilaginibacter dorajii]